MVPLRTWKSLREFLFVNNPRLFWFFVNLFFRHILVWIRNRFITDSDVAAGIRCIWQGVAVLTRGRCSWGTAREADHVSVTHTLTLLFTTIVKTLSLKKKYFNNFKEKYALLIAINKGHLANLDIL